MSDRNANEDQEQVSDTENDTDPVVAGNQKCTYYIVGIGASAGGLEALEQFFANMPANKNMAIVAIQHLSPDYKSIMTELLSKHAKMSVSQIENGMEIHPGCIYMNPPRYNVVISEGKFFLIEQEPVQKINLAIDIFFNSLATEHREKSIGVILSGTGSDGTRGCRAIKEAGGLIISQDEKTAKFNGMPRSVISTKICDYIIAPHKMPEVLLKYTGQASLIPLNVNKEESVDESTDDLSSIYTIINSRYSIDFGLYKQSTILRCLDRRMRICQIPALDEYLSYLKDRSDEVDNLYNSFLIGVTRFFRDKEAFDVIKDKVIPEIVAGKTDNSPIRVWVAGCCTGEEAYSLAILFREYMDTTHKNINVKIFATDIDSNAIDYASAGIYPDSVAADVSLERLNRYFIKKKDVYQVTKNIREMVIFSIHNLISNPPFHKIDLVNCRNVLIYFQSKLQTKVLSTFQFALETKGFMFLGTSETTGELGPYFSTVDAKWKIFKRRDTKKRPLIDNFSVVSTGVKVVQSIHKEDYLTHMSKNSWEMEDIYINLIDECLPPSILVDEDGELVQVCGESDKFLKVPRGRASIDIQKMVPKELSTAIGTAISKVRKEKKTVTYTNINIMVLGEQTNINLVVKPLFTKKNGLLILIIFEEIKSGAVQGDYVENFDTISKLHERIADLEQELQNTRESLQTSIEEIETSSEELQSTNEELLVSNEELHSTNEELQSVNEELIVVNTQYQYKIQELADVNNDMTNFLNSTSIGTIFLDSNLCVRKFTPAITKEINLIEQDIGRPISHISHNLKNEDLIGQAKGVINSLIPVEKEVEGSNNQWYIIKYSPYRTNENIIKGIVISLVDITSRKEAEENQKKSKERYEKLVELSPFAIFIIKDNLIQFSNAEGVNLLQVKNSEHLIGKPLKTYLDVNESQLLRLQLENLQDGESNRIALEDKIIRADGSVIYVEIISTPLSYEYENAQLIVLRDITYRKLSEQLREENMEGKRLLDEARVLEGVKSDFFSNLSHELRTPLNVIMSTIQLLESKVETTTKPDMVRHMHKHMNIMKQNCYRQLRLVNNMIDITKIDTGFFEIKMQNHDIVNVVENITLSVSEYIKAKSIDFIFDTEVEEKIIACDPNNIERIILNLLSNAFKFTDEGGSICVNMYDRGEKIEICVKDSGIGIPNEKLDLIFERFRQVDKSLTRKHEGSGIGLSLAKSLVEIHGGRISVQSEYGIGSTFIVELPVRILQEEEIPVKEDTTLKSNVEKIHLEFSDIYNFTS